MEREEVCNPLLPDELVETIVSMVPFPSIFKVRCLSKSWLARLSPISAQNEEKMNLLAEGFQKEVSERSKNWETFCPVLEGGGNLVGYHQETHSWRILPSLTFLPDWKIVRRKGFITNVNITIRGALLCAHIHSFNTGDIYVARMLTRTWKQLPSPPITESLVRWSMFVVTENMYKVILLCEQDPCDSYLIQIYDSQSDSWSSKNVGNGHYFARGNKGFVSGAYLGGYVYLISDDNPPNLCAFNVEEGAVVELELSSNDAFDTDSCFHLLACQTDLLMIVSTYRNHSDFHRVLKIDRESLRLVQLAEGPPSHLTLGSPHAVPVTDGRCIYFGMGKDDDPILRYNKVRDTWDCLPDPPTLSNRGYMWVGASLQPGLIPFATI